MTYSVAESPTPIFHLSPSRRFISLMALYFNGRQPHKVAAGSRAAFIIIRGCCWLLLAQLSFSHFSFYLMIDSFCWGATRWVYGFDYAQQYCCWLMLRYAFSHAQHFRPTARRHLPPASLLASPRLFSLSRWRWISLQSILLVTLIFAIGDNMLWSSLR